MLGPSRRARNMPMTPSRPRFPALGAALAAALLATTLGACQSTPPPAASAAAPAPLPGLCNDTSLQWAIGKVNDEATVRRLKQESGAGLVNPIGPATITTRDIRRDRLRVYVDAGNVITAARCE